MTAPITAGCGVMGRDSAETGGRLEAVGAMLAGWVTATAAAIAKVAVYRYGYPKQRPRTRGNGPAGKGYSEHLPTSDPAGRTWSCQLDLSLLPPGCAEHSREEVEHTDKVGQPQADHARGGQ